MDWATALRSPVTFIPAFPTLVGIRSRGCPGHCPASPSRRPLAAAKIPGMSEAERKRRGPITLFCESRRFRWAFAVLVLLPALYVASFGPVCWITSRTGIGAPIVGHVYGPILATPWPAARKLVWDYSVLYAAPGWVWMRGHNGFCWTD